MRTAASGGSLALISSASPSCPCAGLIAPSNWGRAGRTSLQLAPSHCGSLHCGRGPPSLPAWGRFWSQRCQAGPVPGCPSFVPSRACAATSDPIATVPLSSLCCARVPAPSLPSHKQPPHPPPHSSPTFVAARGALRPAPFFSQPCRHPQPQQHQHSCQAQSTRSTLQSLPPFAPFFPHRYRPYSPLPRQPPLSSTGGAHSGSQRPPHHCLPPPARLPPGWPAPLTPLTRLLLFRYS